MGNCCSESGQITDRLSYQSLVKIQIKERNIKGKVVRTAPISATVTYPSSQTFDKFIIDKLGFEFSTCVLPGLDPRGLTTKECQDSIFYLYYEESMLVGLFDGHGKEGQKISTFCCQFMKQYFITKYSEFVKDPKEAIENIIVKCDEELRAKSSKIDASLSGSTGLVMYINSKGYFVGSVGDSRAILATIPQPGSGTEDPPQSTNKYIRPIDPLRQLKSVPLSVDQKPNHEHELLRIQKSGGIVQQLTDDLGN